MEDWENDTVCKVMEMLNFTVIPNDKPKETSEKNASAPSNEHHQHQNKEYGENNGTCFNGNSQQQPQHQQSQNHVGGSHIERAIRIVKERELAYQCMMLGTDIFVAREENVSISKRLVDVIGENKKLNENLCKVNEENVKLSQKLKDANTENEKLGKELHKLKEENATFSKRLAEVSTSAAVGNEKLKWEAHRRLKQVDGRLQKLEKFSSEFQCEIKTFLSLFVKAVEKDSESFGLKSEKTDIFVKHLVGIIGKLPVYVLKDWEETKIVFKKLNMLCTLGTISTTGASLSHSPETQVSRRTPTEVTTTTSSPPSRGEEGEDGNGNEDSNRNDTSMAMDDHDNEDIVILEENVSSSRPPVIITPTTVPKTLAAAASANHSNTCVFCGAKFTNTESLIEHLALIHKGCILCKISFANQEMLNHHIQFTHHYWQPESQVSISNPQKATPPPPTGGGGDTSKTQCQSKPNSNPPPPTSHGMVSSDPKDVWNKCLCGYAFMSKKELSVHILSNNNGKS